MLKVLIADDEKNICLMIQKLIAWEDYGMEVIGMVHNGLDAVRVMEERRPDVVISDIRMPGYDGLELVQRAGGMGLSADFIIISGYKYFEYAHKALNLGVEHYLLKPIDKKELTETLERIVQKRRARMDKAREEEALKEQAQQSRRKVQQHFLSSIMEQNQSFRELEIDRVNTEYQCEFEHGCFLAVFAKLDSDVQRQSLTGLLKMMEEIIDGDLKDGDKEYINTTVKSGVITVINYRPELREGMRIGMEKPFLKMRRELDKFQGYHITMGVGSEKNSIAEISNSIHEAVYAIKCRSKAGIDKIIYYDQLRYKKLPLSEFWDEKKSRELENMAEALDIEALRGEVMQNFERISANAFYSPATTYEYLEQVEEHILGVLKKNRTGEEILHGFEEESQKIMDFYINQGEMMYRFTELVRKTFEHIIAERRNRSQLPIRMAKQYVQENYSRQVSLEDVAAAINLSPAYLSTMFKKEMGIHFSDFLTSCRMEAAKELLKTSDLSIAEVAEQVGYMDSRYFSKAFNKVVGLKPSVYRKLYR